jgi:uncharacterized protein with FMN-binding domain
MKKIALSLLLFSSFIVYVFQSRNSASKNSNPSISSTSPTPNNAISNNPTDVTIPSSGNQQKTGFRDGQYTGDSTDALYGNVQIKATISGGKIADVQFLDYPQDRQHSVEINTYAMPILKTEAIQAQNAQVDIVSGATATSQAFVQSLQSALTQAKI